MLTIFFLFILGCIKTAFLHAFHDWCGDLFHPVTARASHARRLMKDGPLSDSRLLANWRRQYIYNSCHDQAAVLGVQKLTIIDTWYTHSSCLLSTLSFYSILSAWIYQYDRFFLDHPTGTKFKCFSRMTTKLGHNSKVVYSRQKSIRWKRYDMQISLQEKKKGNR